VSYLKSQHTCLVIAPVQTGFTFLLFSNFKFLAQIAAVSTCRAISGHSFFRKEKFIHSCAHLMLVTHSHKIKKYHRDMLHDLRVANCVEDYNGTARASLLGILCRYLETSS
jgi:hypothetical protein